GGTVDGDHHCLAQASALRTRRNRSSRCVLQLRGVPAPPVVLPLVLVLVPVLLLLVSRRPSVLRIVGDPRRVHLLPRRVAPGAPRERRTLRVVPERHGHLVVGRDSLVVADDLAGRRDRRFGPRGP